MARVAVSDGRTPKLRWGRLGAALGVLLLLIGTWIGHTLEIVQLSATGAIAPGSVSISPFGGVHSYMLGTGAALIVLATLAAGVLWRVWLGFGRRLDHARASLARALGGGADARREEARALRGHGAAHLGSDLPSPAARLVALWIPLGIAQTALYTIQENVEAHALGRALPGLTILSGAHWAAPAIQAAVALVIAISVVIATWPFRRVSARVLAVVRLLSLLATRVRQTSAPTFAPAVIALKDQLGSHLWQRPPPSAA